MKVDGRKLSHAKLEEIRCAAVKAVQAGQAPSAVARAMELYSNRIFVWLAAYRSGGWDALRLRKASGRPKRLTGVQLKWIYNTVTTRNPLQLRFPFALWTRAMIFEYRAEAETSNPGDTSAPAPAPAQQAAIRHSRR